MICGNLERQLRERLGQVGTLSSPPEVASVVVRFSGVRRIADFGAIVPLRRPEAR